MVSVFRREPDFTSCPICLEALFQRKDVHGGTVVQPVIGLRCQHNYHSRCIVPSIYKRLSLDLQPECPLCREEISAEEITQIESADDSCEFPTLQDDGHILVYAGYDHRLVRQEWADGGKSFYEGGQGSEHVVRYESSSGDGKKFYEGQKGLERCVRAEFLEFKWFYKGEQGAEHVVHRVFPDGDKWFYEGEKGAEHRVRVELSDGDKSFYKGERGVERLVRKELLNGIEQLYEGEQDAERLVREDNVYDEERKHHCVRAYKGERGAEHVVSIHFDNGDEAFFEGEKYAERLVRKVLVDGEQNFYEGERDAEHLVEKVFSNGDKWFYQGARGKEVLVGKGKQALTVQYIYTPITYVGKSLKAKYKRVAASDPEYPEAAKRARLVEEFMQG